MQSMQSNKHLSVLLTAAVFLLVFAALFLGRNADDNTLFSWSWAFAGTEAYIVYLILAGGIAVCAFLSRTAVSDRYHIPLLITLSFGAIVPFWSEPELILDASRYFTQAKHLEMYGVVSFFREWGNAVVAWTDMPLVPFLYGLIFKISGEQRIAIQVFTTLLFSLTALLTYLIGSRLWNRETGFSAALLLLGIPYLLTQVPLMLVDVPTMFFLALSVYTFLDALDRGGGSRTAASVVSIVCAVLSKYSVWFMLSVLPVTLAVQAFRAAPPVRRSVMQRGVAILLTAGVLAGLLLFLKFDTVFRQIALLTEYQKPGLALWSESFTSTFLFQIHPFITLAALLSIAVAVRQRDSRHLIVSWLLLLVVLFAIRRIRYILPVVPMLALMAGYGVQTISESGMRRFLVYGVVTSSLVVALLVYLPFAKSMSAVNLKQAGKYLDTLDNPDVEVITVMSQTPVANLAVSVPLLDLFTGKRIRFDYRAEAVPPAHEVERSPLRFTWEYRNPLFYANRINTTSGVPIVILADSRIEPLPQRVLERLKGYQLRKSFVVNEDIFQFGLTVSIYEVPGQTRNAAEFLPATQN